MKIVVTVIGLIVTDGRAASGGEAIGRLAAPVTALAEGKARADATAVVIQPTARQRTPEKSKPGAYRAELGLQASPGIEPGPGLAGTAGLVALQLNITGCCM